MDTADLARLQDRLDVLELIDRYALTYDSGDREGWLALFSEDANFEMRLPGREKPLASARTRDGLRSSLPSPDVFPPGVTAFHVQSGTVFDELTPTHARARTMVHVVVQTVTDDGAEATALTWARMVSCSVVFGGVYYSKFVKTGGKWLFAERIFVASPLKQHGP